MVSFVFNKIMMAVLLAVLVVFGINGMTDIILEEEELTSSAFPVEMDVPDEHGSDAPVADVPVADVPVVEETPSFIDMLAVASVEKGVKVFKKCKACHTRDNGGKNLVGPNLWNVVGRDKGSLDGFSYSSSMKAAAGNWTYEDLNTFLKKPGDFVPKTKMSFAGLKKAGDRAAIIAMLRTLSDAPIDLPAVEDVIKVTDTPAIAAEVPAE